MLSSKRGAPRLEVKPFLFYRNSSLRVRRYLGKIKAVLKRLLLAINADLRSYMTE
jgi:hypothetical protein